MTDKIRNITLVIILLAVSNVPSFADSDHDRAKKLKEAGNILPLENILDKTSKEYPGHILEVELELEGNRLVYELEILDNNGVVRKLRLDAKTGEILSSRKDR